MNPMRGLLVLATAVAMTGCATRPGLERDEPTASLAPDPAPLVTDRFLLTQPEQRVVGELQVIRARAVDTFVDIARTYNLGFDELVQANPDIDPWLPGEGTRVVLPTRFVLPDVVQEGIVINLAAKRLYFFPPPDAEGGRAVVTFPIGIGREGAATPLGATTVTQKGADPVWYPTASIRREYAAEGNPLPAAVPPGPDNPLGKFVLKLGMPSYLIHGTNRPAGVGMRVSHGCVRLFPENIEYLYGVVPVGVPVRIVNEPYLFASDAGELVFEAHPPLADDTRDWPALLPQRVAAFAARHPAAGVAEARVNAIAAAARGMPFAVTSDTADPDVVIDRAVVVTNLVEVPPDVAVASIAEP